MSDNQQSPPGGSKLPTLRIEVGSTSGREITFCTVTSSGGDLIIDADDVKIGNRRVSGEITLRWVGDRWLVHTWSLCHQRTGGALTKIEESKAIKLIVTAANEQVQHDSQFVADGQRLYAQQQLMRRLNEFNRAYRLLEEQENLRKQAGLGPSILAQGKELQKQAGQLKDTILAVLPDLTLASLHIERGNPLAAQGILNKAVTDLKKAIAQEQQNDKTT